MKAKQGKHFVLQIYTIYNIVFLRHKCRTHYTTTGYITKWYHPWVGNEGAWMISPAQPSG